MTVFRPHLLAKKKVDPREALNQHKVAFNRSQKALNEENTARAATAAALAARRSPVSDLEAEDLSLKELNRELMQDALPAPHENNCKKLDCPFAASPTGMLGIFLKPQRGSLLLAGKKSRQALFRL